MNTPARELVVSIKTAVKILIDDPAYGSLRAVLEDLSQRSGVSASAIHKIYDGRAENPTVRTVDRLVDAVKQAMKKAAA